MSQRVLIVNKFYYPRGGDCVCTFNLEQLLKEKGHEVAVYAMQYPQNIESEYTKYFAKNVTFSGGIGNKIQAAARIFGSGIKASFSRMLHDFKPDVVHFNNIHSYLSPALVDMAHKFGARTVWTLHDYKLICPSYSCLCNGNTCELCFSDKSNVLKHKCMKGSSIASALAYMEAKYWNASKLQSFTDKYICPSEFMLEKMIQGGFSADKLTHICNFVDPIKLKAFESIDVNNRENYYCYIGRLSHEKGVRTLLKAAAKLPYKLYVAGDGPLKSALTKKYDSNNIEFVGHLNATDVVSLVSRAKAMVLPSEWYENNPLSVIESLCMGTPVIGANIGGIPELITADNGCVFESGDKQSLTQRIVEIFEDSNFNYSKIAQTAQEAFSPDTHYNTLMKVYQ